MDEYIEREAAIKKVAYICVNYGVSDTTTQRLKKHLKSIPAADARPVVHGRWVEDKSGVIYCSECGEEHEWVEFRANFCDNCGADMREANDEH